MNNTKNTDGQADLFLLFSRAEFRKNAGGGFWANESGWNQAGTFSSLPGWTSLPQAAMFTAADKAGFDLSTVNATDSEWLAKDQALQEISRKQFENRVFTAHFLSTIKKTGLGGCLTFLPDPQLSLTKQQLCERDEAGDYKRPEVDAMWWGWCEAFNRFVPSQTVAVTTLVEGA